MCRNVLTFVLWIYSIEPLLIKFLFEFFHFSFAFVPVVTEHIW